MNAKATEIMNIKISAGSRRLYLDLKENADGSRFLSMSEVRADRGGERSRILIDEQYVADLHRALGAVVQLVDADQPRVSYTLEEKRRDHPRAYKPWTDEEETELKDGYVQGRGIDALARQHERAPSAVLSRLCQIGLVKPNENPYRD